MGELMRLTAMNMAKGLNTSIPLLCSLCPNSPRFSDISHLLTHISSKSHLAHRFKIQIRSQGEPRARQLLDDFETWYAENGLEEMLSERMAAKDQKNTGKRVRNSMGNSKKSTKKDAKPRTRSKPLAVSAPAKLSLTPRALEPRMHDWPTTSQRPAENTDIWESKDFYATPTAQRKLPDFAEDDSVSRRTRGALAKKETPSKQDDVGEHLSIPIPDKVEKVSDATRLKGVFWPGMALFDSATDDMKRNRNQKKDVSILQKMILSSAEVEPNEWILDADFETYKIRSMYDPSNSSPFGSDSTSPAPPKKRRQKNALAGNSGSSHLSGRIATGSPRRISKRAQLSGLNVGEMQNKMSQNPFEGFEEHFEGSADEEEEFRLTVDDMGKQKPFGIFRDVSPGRTESPLEEARFDLPMNNGIPQPLPLQSISTNRAMHNSPNTFENHFKPTGIISFEKNTSGLAMNSRRMQSAANGFPPQVFHDQSFNPLLYSSHAHTFVYGDRYGSYGDENVMSFSAFNGNFKPSMSQPSAMRDLPIEGNASNYAQRLEKDAQFRM